MADFPWDVAQLPRNTWDLDGLIRNVTRERIEISRTSNGDLTGGHPLVNTDRVRVRFECPRRFAFNIARHQVINEGQQEPAADTHVEWKQDRKGLWYVRSLDEMRVLRDEKGTAQRIRTIMKYTEFETNAQVDSQVFSKDPIQFAAPLE